LALRAVVQRVGPHHHLGVGHRGAHPRDVLERVGGPVGVQVPLPLGLAEDLHVDEHAIDAAGHRVPGDLGIAGDEHEAERAHVTARPSPAISGSLPSPATRPRYARQFLEASAYTPDPLSTTRKVRATIARSP